MLSMAKTVVGNEIVIADLPLKDNAAAGVRAALPAVGPAAAAP